MGVCSLLRILAQCMILEDGFETSDRQVVVAVVARAAVWAARPALVRPGFPGPSPKELGLLAADDGRVMRQEVAGSTGY